MCLHYFCFKMNMYLIFKNTEKGHSCPPLPPSKFPCSCRPNGRIEKTSGNLQSLFLPLPYMQLFCSQTASVVSLRSPYLHPPPVLFSSPWKALTPHLPVGILFVFQGSAQIPPPKSSSLVPW